MKTEFADLSDTKKSVAVEIPSDIVDAQIDRVARSYSRQARIPGFRQGKVPPTLIKKRFREQILHDVAHDLIPRAIDEALRERGLEPVDTPDVKDVTLDEGQPLTFTATFETLPPIDPGPLEHHFAAPPGGDARRGCGREGALAAADRAPRGTSPWKAAASRRAIP